MEVRIAPTYRLLELSPPPDQLPGVVLLAQILCDGKRCSPLMVVSIMAPQNVQEPVTMSPYMAKETLLM